MIYGIGCSHEWNIKMHIASAYLLPLILDLAKTK